MPNEGSLSRIAHVVLNSSCNVTQWVRSALGSAHRPDQTIPFSFYKPATATASPAALIQLFIQPVILHELNCSCGLRYRCQASADAPLADTPSAICLRPRSTARVCTPDSSGHWEGNGGGSGGSRSIERGLEAVLLCEEAGEALRHDRSLQLGLRQLLASILALEATCTGEHEEFYEGCGAGGQRAGLGSRPAAAL